MKPLIILSIIVVLFGAGCKPAVEKDVNNERIDVLENRIGPVADVVCTDTNWDHCEKQTVDSRLDALEKGAPIMVTVQLKTPIKGMRCIEGKCFDYDRETTTQIPLQEFVDLLDFKYVPATSTTSNQPAKLVK